MRSRRCLTSSLRDRTCSPRLPVRSSRSRNPRPICPPYCGASPGWRRWGTDREASIGPGLSAAAGRRGSRAVRIRGVPLAGNATRVATLDVIALGRASALSGMAPLAPDRASPMGVPSQSFFDHLCELLLIASLWALAAAALPGVGGLLTLTAAGVRVGYRQAKAGFAVRPAGIARFAPPGRISSVVRSESSVGVRPRTLRVVHPGTLSTRWLPD